jgi:glycosyltransferase involved in cell wall biosynthesis
MKNTFIISCPIDTYSGYGARSRDLVKSIIELDKYDVKILSQRWGQTPFGFVNDHPEWHFLKNHMINSLNQKPDIWAQITVPNEFQAIGKFNIGFTAGIETTLCAAPWIEGMNRMDLNIVSSEHSKQVFLNSKFNKVDPKTNQNIGVVEMQKPIEVLLEGANLNIYKPIEEDEITELNLLKDINSIPEDFAFLSVGHWMQGSMGEDRKNIGVTLKSFYETFKNKKKQPALILKTSSVNSSYMDRREIMKRVNAVRSSCEGKLPNVYILHGNFTNEEMNELYNHPKIKAMVSHTRGEGFGRPLLEFSLVNKPIICSGWSGQLDFLQNDFTLLLQGALTNVHPSAQQKDMILAESQWFQPNPQEIHRAYKEIFDNYKTWVIKAKRQGYYSRTYFAFENMKAKIIEILDKNVKIVEEVALNLPKLKKIENKQKLPKLKLPKLSKI